jgi:uncharacterized protein
MKTSLVAVITLIFSVASVPALSANCVPQREAVSLQLPDFVSAAELVSPPNGRRPRGLLILFSGSDVADMDSAIVGAGGVIVSRPMRQVADTLACAGFITMRYNKRFVTGSTTVDRAAFDTLNGVDFANDGRAALAFAKQHLGSLNLPIGLVGWSEGTTVAMSVAASEPSIRAVVLMAPVIEPSATVARLQYGRIGKPYLASFATDGALDADAIARADAGPGGILAHIFVRMFRGFRPGERVNPLLDTNGDGRITFAEADPIIESWYADGPNSGLGMSSSARALPSITNAMTDQTPPMLILQGRNDSMIGPEAALAFSKRPDVRARVWLKVYRGLGHSLGPATSPQTDGLVPMAEHPLTDVTNWLKQKLRN